MDAFLTFFEQMPNWQKLVWILSCLTVSWLLEGAIPLVSPHVSQVEARCCELLCF